MDAARGSTASRGEEIALSLRVGRSMRSIARRLGRSVDDHSRGEDQHGHRGHHNRRTHERARDETRRPTQSTVSEPVRCATVTSWLERLWSPSEIAERLKIEFAGDPR